MSSTTPESEIDGALRQFGVAEANLEKLERIFSELRDLVPDHISFGSNPQYDDLCSYYEDILDALPKIDEWKPTTRPIDLNELAQWKFDAAELGEPEVLIGIDEEVEKPGRELRSYRRLLNKKRRQLVRDKLTDVFTDVDSLLRDIGADLADNAEPQTKIKDEQWDLLKNRVQIIDTLLGSSLTRPQKWGDFSRHFYSSQVGGLRNIIKNGWPEVKNDLINNLYHENEPIPVATEDLGALATTKPRGTISIKLNWDTLDAENFERLMFALISNAQGYENPEWLMCTNAPDRGRDLSVIRVTNDDLVGVVRQRLIMQCKRLINKSVSTKDIASLIEQIKLWQPPRVDVLVIATTGRFTSDAVAVVEKRNNEDHALRIEMWPESHLERLLASRPALIAQYNLR